MILFVVLERTAGLGELIIIIQHMARELGRFLVTFGLLIFLFVLTIKTLKMELKADHRGWIDIIKNIFDTFTGITHFDEYNMPNGSIYMTFIVVFVTITLISFLVAMFVNRLQVLHGNLDALRRMMLTQLKNSSDYDRYYGGVTNTFFPTNIFVLPFIPFIVAFKSERLSEFTLKVQYGMVIFFYCIIGIVSSIPLIPLIYAKSLANGYYIAMNGRKQEYKGQYLVKLLLIILLNPIIVVMSLLVDLLTVPPQLLQDHKKLKSKYQQALDHMSEEQGAFLIPIIIRFFYVEFYTRFKDMTQTLKQLMLRHRQIFSI